VVVYFVFPVTLIPIGSVLLGLRFLRPADE
jgi:hypothetical protein